VTVFQLHAKRRVWQVLNDLTLHLNDVVLGHSSSNHLPASYQLALKLAFFNNDSYCWLIT
jgi:predicted metal-dependent phosphotriesterase family hydrolase